jgi:Fusaric acid resistance protein-like
MLFTPRWVSGHAAEPRLMAQVTVAAVIACCLASVMTAIIVMQASLGASVQAAIDRIAGTIGGAAWGYDRRIDPACIVGGPGGSQRVCGGDVVASRRPEGEFPRRADHGPDRSHAVRGPGRRSVRGGRRGSDRDALRGPS